ncbi:unnamed protein product [Arabis nemorensis]|uniref:NYN domain-containing protein n=1 Tax=Arabis nemorensis TaxID=586526 RepID=A0A565BW03_9BRAS|nr:unnamed protein product [Arabis nemorensis]
MPSSTTIYAEAKTGVFWDVEDCPILNGLDPASISQNIKSALANQGYRGEIEIKAYKEKKTIRNDFQLAGINLIIAGDRHGRFKAMFEQMRFWMIENRASNVLIISRDKTDHTPYLQNWTARNYNILFAEPENPPEKCCNCRAPLDKDKPLEPIIGSAECESKCGTEPNIENEDWVWTSLAMGGGPLTKTKK